MSEYNAIHIGYVIDQLDAIVRSTTDSDAARRLWQLIDYLKEHYS